MQHAIELDALRTQVGAAAGPMANAVSACVHCGFCLPACPTYIELGEEMDSPRGRIVLMKEVLEGGLALEEALGHIDPCLGCMSCVTACPSGVEYGELLMPFRELAEGGRHRSWFDRFWRGLMLDTLASPGRLRWMLRLGRLAAPFRRLLPARFTAPLDLLPRSADRAEVEFGTFPAVGERRARVALLAGCAQQVLAPRIQRATIEVLTRSGVEVVVPKEESCCGSLAFHAGDAPRARAAAGALLRVLGPAGLLPDVDAILTNAAGCGSGLKEYGLLFAGRPEEETARALAAKVRDVSTFLAALEAPPPPLAQPLRVVYHDACHLAHAQRERTAPRRLLAQVRGVTLVEPRDWQICCGSAGIYNLEEPELAARLGRRKAKALLEGEPDVIVTGNIGCLTQIESHLRRLDSAVPVRHTMEVLASAHGAGYPAPAR
ncbi:MAG: 4Fe-4S dicluster domain-containing protein [Holophagales bacterium]|nr:4Fe-4S dicluster domain-containing protein [Holophagales bacterium]MYC10013.1 4Fe-4S dicluster domain-containing protein [Holophagales bacterium]